MTRLRRLVSLRHRLLARLSEADDAFDAMRAELVAAGGHAYKEESALGSDLYAYVLEFSEYLRSDGERHIASGGSRWTRPQTLPDAVAWTQAMATAPLYERISAMERRVRVRLRRVERVACMLDDAIEAHVGRDAEVVRFDGQAWARTGWSEFGRWRPVALAELS